MSISPGFTSAEIREYVFEYHQQRQGTKGAWLARQPFSKHQFRRWQKAVFGGELDRGLILRESGSMTSTPRQKRATIERSLAAQQEAHDAEIAAMEERIQSLEESNRALGKAIGLLHAMNVEEPEDTPTTTDPSDSSTPSTSS